MEDDIDIYADLPSFNLNLDKNDQPCNCEKLKKELSSLKNELENIQKVKENLEKNISSLLKTARAEIARKDKMISDLRKRLDDATFRRNNKGELRDFSTYKSSYQQHMTVEKYEDAPLMHSQEDETVLHETEFHRNEYKNEKLEYNNQQPTVFAERLYKRIIKDEIENTKQKTLNYDIEIKKKIAEENIVESDKENGSQSNINNGNESNAIIQHSDSEDLCRKNSGKRMNEEDGTRGSKRLKIDTEDKIDDSTVQCELQDDLAQYEMKTKFENRLNAIHPLKEEEISLDNRRAASEHRDMLKQGRDCINGWKREDKSSSRIASTSNHVSEESHNGYKKNVYSSRYSPRRSYSRSRSDYESSSDHRSRERSNRTYRKYDDYKYDNQYRTKRQRDYRLKRDYESIENESKTRHRSREHGDVTWVKSRHSSDVEDKEGNNSYTNKKYESHRIKKSTTNVSCNKDLHERDKVAMEMDSRTSYNHTIVNNTMNYSVKKTTEQNKVKNESNRINHIDSIKNTSTCIATKDSSNLEEGEIVDSPQKKFDSTKISKNHKVENKVENDTKIIIEDKKDAPMIASVTDDKSITLQNDIITAKQLNNVTDINIKEVETGSCLVQTMQKNPEEIAELISSDKNDAIVDEVQNRDSVEDICKSQCNENLTDPTTCTIGMIEQVCESQCNEDLRNSTTCTIGTINPICDSNVDINDENHAKEESFTEIAIKIEEMADTNTKNITEVKKIDEPNVESAINKDKVNNSNIESPVIIAEANSSVNNIRKIDDKELKSSTAEVVEKVEVALNCDIENKDVNQVPSKIFQQTSGKSEINHLCLSDHNYVQDPSPVNASDSNVVQDSSISSEHCKTMPEATTIKETKLEEEIDVSLTIDVKKTMSSMVKNKKNQLNKGVVISRRRRAVMLSDSNASMTVLMNTKTSSNVISNSSNESILKPRACKASRSCK